MSGTVGSSPTPIDPHSARIPSEAGLVPLPGGATDAKTTQVAGSRLKHLILKHAKELQLGENIQRVATGNEKTRATFERQALSSSSLSGSEGIENFSDLIQNVKTLLKGDMSNIMHKLSSTMLTAKAGVDALNQIVGDEAYFGAVVTANIASNLETGYSSEIATTAVNLDLVSSLVGTAASAADGLQTMQAVKTKRKLQKMLADSKALEASPKYKNAVYETQTKLRYRMQDLTHTSAKAKELREAHPEESRPANIQEKIDALDTEIDSIKEDIENLTAESIKLYSQIIRPKNAAKINSMIEKLDHRIHDNAKERCLMGAANVAYFGGSVAAKVATGAVGSTIAVVGGSILFGAAHFASNELGLAKEKKTAKSLDKAIEKYSDIMLSSPDDPKTAGGLSRKGASGQVEFREYSKPMMNISALKTRTLMSSQEKYTKSNIRMRKVNRSIGPTAVLAGSLILAGAAGPFGAIPLGIGLAASMATKMRTVYKQNLSSPIARKRSKVALSRAKTSFKRGFLKFGIKLTRNNSPKNLIYKRQAADLKQKITHLNLLHQKLLAVELINSSAPQKKIIKKGDSDEVIASKEKYNAALAASDNSETATNIRNILAQLSKDNLSNEERDGIFDQAIGEVEDVARSFAGKCFLPAPPPGVVDPAAKDIKKDIAKKYDLYDKNGEPDPYAVTPQQVIAWLADYGMQ